MDKIYRTTNTGLSWDSVSPTGSGAYKSLSFINKDTGWVSGFDGFSNTIYITTNGGVTLTAQTTSSGFGQIFFLPQKVNGQYIGWNGDNTLYKTTNSGTSWFQTASISADNEIYFINKDTGWISNGGMFKSTDGGASWINEPMPNGGIIVSTNIFRFVFINKNIGWGIGGIANYGGSLSRGIIWKTTNGGLNWGYQQPDTTINIFVYGVTAAVDSLNAWAFNASGNKGVHTTNGGGQIIYTGVNIISTEIPTDYKLFQNYPNPFNPSTKIKFQISKTGYTEIKIFDILGRELTAIVKGYLNPGLYETDFEANNYSSGIYFYRLTVNGNIIDTKKMSLVK